MMRKAFFNIGRRGISLLIIGLIVLLLGSSLISNPPANSAPLILLTVIAPLKWWGFVWAISGGFMMIAGFWKNMETAAFGIGTSLFSMLATSYLYYILVETPVLWGGMVRVAVIYYGMGIWLQIISGWPEVPKIPEAPRPETLLRKGR